MTRKTNDKLSDAQRAMIEKELSQAYDFDPRDPLFGLSRDELSGPGLSRRTVLRLMAAAGTLTAANVLPVGGIMRPAQAGPSGGTLTCGWAGVGQIVTLDPAQINQVVQFQISSNVLSGLMHINRDLVGEGDLAESWTVSEDGREYVFKLREGVTFHNGDPFTADDVIFTYNRSKDPEKSIHSRVIKNVADVVKLNDYEVKFVLAKPQASFLTKTLERSSGRAMTIVSRGALEAMGTSDYGLRPVGTGPFRVVEHQLGQGVVLEKFEEYYDPERPKLDKVIIKPISDAEPLAAAIEAGDIQLIGGNGIPGELVDRFVSNPDLVVDEVPGPGFQSVWINPWHENMRVPDFNKPLSELLKEPGFKIPWAVDRDRHSGSVGLLRHPSAQETVMNKHSSAIIMPAAIRTNLGAIFVSLELSRSRWIVTSLSPGGAEKMSKHTVPGGDLAGLMERFQLLVAKAKARTGRDFPIVVIQEAGLDGFWIHRALEKEGIESHVVDPASIATSRRRRRAKTDRIDGEALVRTLLAFKRGEPRVCAMVRAPSPEDEDTRRIMRERKTLTGERVAHVNRIKGLLFAQGVSGYEPLRRDRRKRLEELRTGDGRELPRHLKAQILRELDRLELVLAQIKAVENERDAELAQAREAALPASAARLMEIRGIGPEFAMLIWSEGLYRHFDNRRQVAAYAGLAPTPWQSGAVDHEQGVSKAGNPRLRTTMIQLAWLWLQHQPTSALTQWFRDRVAHQGGRSRKPAIVALARKLLVALWKYVAAGVVIEGAAMKPA